MANQEVTKFLNMIKADKALEATLQKEMVSADSAESALNKAVAIAREKGLSFTSAELKAQLPNIKPPADGGELSDKELSNVAGGFAWAQKTLGSSNLWCAICAMGTSGGATK